MNMAADSENVLKDFNAGSNPTSRKPVLNKTQFLHHKIANRVPPNGAFLKTNFLKVSQPRVSHRAQTSNPNLLEAFLELCFSFN